MTRNSKRHRPLRCERAKWRTLQGAAAAFPAAILFVATILPCLIATDAAAAVCMPTIATPGSVMGAASSSPPSGAKTPSQIQTAYGINAITLDSITGSGTGQTIAIIDAYDDPNIINDTKNFSTTCGLQQFNVSGGPTLTVLNQSGGTALPGTDPSGPGNRNGTWEEEESLDVEWAHSIAPKANIILYEASSASMSDLMAAVSTAAGHSNVSVVSMSFGTGEFSGETSYDSYFTTPTGHAKVAFVASTGDASARANIRPLPNVVAAGGTSLTLNSNNTWKSEKAWGTAAPSGRRRRRQQRRVGQRTGANLPKRRPYHRPDRHAGDPRISFDSDPNTGVAVYDSYDFGGSTPWAGNSAAPVCRPPAYPPCSPSPTSSAPRKD